MKSVIYNNAIKVFYDDALDGGGLTFGQQYIGVVAKRFGTVDTLAELFAGPAFIGFSLLAHGLCKKLVLADINPHAQECCDKTIRENNLQDKVTFYLSDCFDGIPKTTFDLIVGNPPHRWTASEAIYQSDIRTYDPSMRIHKKSYEQAPRFLSPDGSILLQESSRATKLGDFAQMINENGLRVIKTFKAPPVFSVGQLLKFKNPYYQTKHYFIWCKKDL